MRITFTSPRSRFRCLGCWALLLSLAPPSYAADKPQTLTGTISLGAGRFALNTSDGKVITFMGKGGNKVFAKCRNSDRCEITGTVVYNTKLPLFISVTRVKKLGHAAPATPTPASADKQDQPAAARPQQTQNAGKLPANEASKAAAMTGNPPPDKQDKPDPAAESAQQPVAQEATPDVQPGPVESPLLPETPDPPATQSASPP